MDSYAEATFNGFNSGLQVAVNHGVINHGPAAFALHQHVPIIEEALYDSHTNEHEEYCLEQTRTDLLAQVREWAASPDSKCILWLNGMAGTGKSTIARTIARSFKNNRLLGATYFFKRGEGDRGKARYLFSSIIRQLLTSYRQLAPDIEGVISTDPWIASKSLDEQFDKLLFRPLMNMKLKSDQPPTTVIVIDALDECDRENHTREIIRLLSKLREVGSLNLRVFLTSRPEFPIRLGFRHNDSHRDLILHNIPVTVIRNDIRLFLSIKLAEIQDERSLPYDWPGDRVIDELVSMAAALFIFAATVYRFVKNGRHPRKRLQQFLSISLQNHSATQMDKIYLPVLNQLLEGDPDDVAHALEEFQEIVGTIILLATPLSIESLSLFLRVPVCDITEALSPLHSLLSVPSTRDAPVRILHLSFHDYLLSPNCPFQVNERNTHRKTASRCLQVMEGQLKRNICNFASFGIESKNINSQVIDEHLTSTLQYSCRYWVYHMQESQGCFTELDSVMTFLSKHFLHWLEALALIGKVFDAVKMTQNLHSIASDADNERLSEFLVDAKRFALQNSSVATIAPLQLYYSGLVFAPSKSLIRQNFGHELARKLHPAPVVDDFWPPIIQTLVGHSNHVGSVAYSPDGRILASGSTDKTIKLWDTVNGAEMYSLKSHSDMIHSVAFSPDGRMLASSANDIKLWNTTTWREIQTLSIDSDRVYSVAFSSDSQILAFSDKDSIHLWDLAHDRRRQKLIGHSDTVVSVVFSPDTHTLASASSDRTVKLWEIASGTEKQTLRGHSSSVTSIAFSPNGRILASGSMDRTIRLWDLASNPVLEASHSHFSAVSYSHHWAIISISFSPDGTKLASCSRDSEVRIWDMANGNEYQSLKGHSGTASSVLFSPDGQTLATGSEDHTIKLWNTPRTTGQSLKSHWGMVYSLGFAPDGHTLISSSSDHPIGFWDIYSSKKLLNWSERFRRLESVAFSPGGLTMATASGDCSIRIWDIVSGYCTHELSRAHEYRGRIWSMSFSPSIRLLAASSGSSIRVWDAGNSIIKRLYKLEFGASIYESVVFSPNSQLLASNGQNKGIKIWDSVSGNEWLTLDTWSHRMCSLAFSSDNQILASGSVEGVIIIWDIDEGTAIRTIDGHSQLIYSLQFSPGSRTLVSGSKDSTIKVWDTASGTEQLIPDEHFDSVGSASHSNQSDMQVSLSDSCIRVSGETPLWLPAEYRAFTCHAVMGNKLALGYTSGKMLIIGFDEPEDPWKPCRSKFAEFYASAMW